MYNKSSFSMAARGLKMLGDFKNSSVICGAVAKSVDADFPAHRVAELIQHTDWLEDELRKMRRVLSGLAA